MEQKRLIVVLGMHRCGTSAITRGLQVLGVHLGNRLMPLDAGNNDKGFWEDIDINALNVEMLSALNNDWHHLSLIKQEDFEVLKRDGFFLRAAELVQQKTVNAPLYGFKDPRISKLLPFWKEVFNYCNYDVSYILAVRHPISVALSLAKRNGIDMEKSHLLWLIHLIKSLSGITGSNYIVVDYDNLMQNAGHELNRIADKFHLKIDYSEFENYKSAFLDEGLRHTRFTYNDLMTHERSFDLLKDVYACVTELANGNIIEKDILRTKIGKWEAELEKLNSSFIMTDAAFYQLNLIYLQTLEKDEYIRKEKKAKELEVQKLNESLEKLHKQDEHIEQLIKQLSEKTDIIAEKENNIAHMGSTIANQEDVIKNKEYTIAEQEQIILHEKEEKYKIQTSISWRITKPLRYIEKLLRNIN